MDQCFFEADIEKELGNIAYKNRDFNYALERYKNAARLVPNNIIYRNNIGAVFYEQGDYLQCISECQLAAKIGTLNKSSSRLIAKAYSRIGNSFLKLKDYQAALYYLKLSLQHHYEVEVFKVKSQVDEVIRLEKKRLFSKELFTKGNFFFKKGNFPQALRYFSQALELDQTNPELFMSRADCFAKLLEFKSCIRDCEKCLQLDPQNVNCFIRKGLCLSAMAELKEAESCFLNALQLQPNNNVAVEGFKRCLRQSTLNAEFIKRQALRDPSVLRILRDPTIQKTLHILHSSPQSIKNIKNPEFAKKIEKLLEFGLVALR